MLPVLEGIAAAKLDVEVSIDTSKAPVARAAIAAGASIVNDVSALRGDAAMVELIADSGVECCLMHMLGEPRTMQREPRYEDVVDDVKAFLEERLAFAVSAGDARGADHARPRHRLWQDRRAQPRAARRLDELAALGRPLLVGTSRKSFLGRLAARAARARAAAGARSRLPGTIATTCSRSSAAPACSASTTSPRSAMRSPWRLLPWAGDGRRGGRRRAGRDDDDLDEERDRRRVGHDRDHGALAVHPPGVSEAEREVGQRLVVDLRLDIGETDATVTDSIEDTVDYAEVCQLVALLAQQRSHKTLERLCSTIADRLLADYELEGVWVKAAKPEPPIALAVDEVSVEVWRESQRASARAGLVGLPRARLKRRRSPCSAAGGGRAAAGDRRRGAWPARACTTPTRLASCPTRLRT